MNQHFVPRLDHFEFYSALDTTQTAYSRTTPRPTRKLLDTATGEFITPTMTTPTKTQPNDGIVAKLAVGEFASGTVAASVTDSPEPPLLALAWLIAKLTTIPALMFMQAGGGQRRGQMARVPDPPSYDPANERREPFRLYTQRLMIWAILAADLDPGQQCASIINMLRGDAQVLGLQLSYADITQGAMVNGVQVDPVTSLLSQLAAAFAPLGEEARIQAMSEIMNFHRQGANETTDALIQRFKMLKWRAAQGNAGINMTWEGYTWLLLKAVGLSQSTLIQVLQPFQGRFPNVEAEFDQMCMALRRLGHIYENTPHNIAHALHTPPGRMFPVFNGGGIPSTGGLAFPVGQPDPWSQPAGDPWGGGFGAGNAFSAAPTAAPANPFVSYEQQQYQAYPVQQPNSDEGYITGTDSDTESSFGEEINYDSAEFAGLNPHQISEKIWWGYARGKSLWRRHTHKPVRKVRRFIKRKGGGKGRSKGKGRYLCLEQLPDTQISQVFFGGGKSGGKRTTGKGKGRKKNPTGPDGAVMTCSICGSEDHFRAACPRGASGSAHLCQPTGSFSGFWAVGTDSLAAPAVPKATGPLADILFHNAVDTTAFTTMLTGEVDGIATNGSRYSWQQVTDTGAAAVDAVNITPPFHVPELTLPYAETAFFRDPFTASSPGPNLLQENILEMNTQWTGNAYGTAAEQRAGTLDDEVQLRFDATLRDRYLTVERAVAVATHPPPKAMAPMPTRDFQTEFPGFGAFGDQGRQYRQQLLERRANLTGPAAKAAAWATGTAPPHVPPTWSGDARGPGVSSNAAYPQQEASHAEQPPAMAAFAKHGLQARPFHEDLARARRQAAAQELANHMQGTTTGSGRPTVTDDGSHCCTICMETYQPTDQVSYLICTHHFHIGCIDTWCAMQLLRNGINEVLGCPLCRQEISVSNILEAYGLPSAVDEFLDAHNQSGSSSRSSVAQGAFPIFPARLGVHNNDSVASQSYLTTSTLKDRLALIIDTGAFTSITGATLARSLAMVAKQNGVPVEQVKLDKPMKIGGVGQGTETCNYALKTTLAVEHIGDGASHLHEWTAPIVEGNGEHLPGLLGMDSLEKNRAIIDAGRGRLIYP